MPHITLLCRCRSARTVLFVVRENGLYALPDIRMRPAEDRMGAFGTFIADHFAVDPDGFQPEFREFGLPGSDSVQIAFCSVNRQVNALADPGVESHEFRWISRMECQQEGLFEERTLAILQHRDVQRLLFGIVARV